MTTIEPSMRDRRVFLSVSIPSPKRASQFRRYPNAPVLITESVIALTRAILGHGGELVMTAHPTFSPLVAQVAGEYRFPAVVEGVRSEDETKQVTSIKQIGPRIIVYQSRAFENHVPKETLFLDRLGYAQLVWVDVIDNETFKPRARHLSAS